MISFVMSFKNRFVAVFIFTIEEKCEIKEIIYRKNVNKKPSGLRQNEGLFLISAGRFYFPLT